MSKAINSKVKGSNGEREAAAKLRELGISEARRDGQQGSGDAAEHPDVKGVKGWHVEVKRQERFGGHEMYQALDQAKKDRAPGEQAVVLHRKNHKPWVAIMNITDYAELVHIQHMYNALIQALTEQYVSV